ncbi:MAG TPA: hypothetical protein VI197_29645 [Polyangiaceae bacterium]
MSDRKRANSVDPLARLTSIEAPEFLDQLVLERGRAVLAGRANAPQGETRRRASEPAGVAALFARLLPPRLKSS